MPRKPQPPPPPEPIPAPPHLSERARGLWASLTATRIRRVAHLALLQAALDSLDRADGAKAILDAEGVVVRPEAEGKGIARVHPAVRIEKDARGQFLAAWRQLGLDDVPRW